MKKLGYSLFLFLLWISCANEFSNALKSSDKELILKVANERFARKKWTDALSLYERLPDLVKGTKDASTVVFNSAYAHYHLKEYRLAGHQFKKFSTSFPKDPRSEEAAYMSALCYYKGSQEFNLDQTNTDLAINELQSFIKAYPDSDRAKNVNALIEELSYKLEYKEFENAKQYFKMGYYKAAIVVFENFLEDFPATKLRAKVYAYILKSRHELAVHSVYDLKGERIESALAYISFIEKQSKDSFLVKKALELKKHLLQEKSKYEKQKEEVENHKAKIQARLERQKLENSKK
ncbi:MAG: outer membrane protein assembly factor BamD [Bergeyella sp.]|nr:outer membrane protein assembly factor BamD [Bergeyella sp.]